MALKSRLINQSEGQPIAIKTPISLSPNSFHFVFPNFPDVLLKEGNLCHVLVLIDIIPSLDSIFRFSYKPQMKLERRQGETLIKSNVLKNSLAEGVLTYKNSSLIRKSKNLSLFNFEYFMCLKYFNSYTINHEP